MAIEPHIGTLNEGSLHRALKDWVSIEGDRFEVPLGDYVIDIARDDLLIEIQTGSLGAMRRKLDRLLEEHRVRVVLPLAAVRWLERPGKPRRRSPKKAGPWNVFDALVSVPTLLCHANAELLVVLIEQTDVRSERDRVARGRRGRVVDRRLDRVLEHRLLTRADELLEVLPPSLPDPFTTAQLAEAAGIRRDLAQRACYVLRHCGLVSEVGRARAGLRYSR